MSNLRFTLLEPIKVPLVNKFYDKHGARGRALKADQVWVAYNAYDIIGACRVQNQSGYLFLSTLYIDPQWRGNKVASKLLHTTIAAQQGTVFTFVYQNLIDFYMQNGFNYILTLPNPLRLLFQQYAHRNIVPMQFSRIAAPN